jgi:hypothetical protein
MAAFHTRYHIFFHLPARQVRIVLLVLFMTCSLWSKAQTEQEHVIDTSAYVSPVEPEQVIDDADAAYRGKEEVTETPVFREVPDSVTARLKKDKDFRYANDPSYWVTEPEEMDDGITFMDRFYRFFRGDAVRTIFYILLAGLLLYIIYRVVVVNKLYMIYSSKKSKDDDDGPSDITEDDLEENIQKAIAAKQHRQAVRYLYLKTLRRLSEKGLIRLHAQATNYDYVNQLNQHSRAEEFRFLTRIYDYVWYGEFGLTDEQFDLVHANFRRFYDAL